MPEEIKLADVVTNFISTGADTAYNSLVKLTTGHEALQYQLQTSRTQLLYMSFGLYATAGLIGRAASALTGMTAASETAFIKLQEQVYISASIFRGEFERNVSLISEASMNMSEFGYSALDVADAFRVFAQAGIEVDQAATAMRESLIMARLSNMELEDSVKTVIVTANQFGLTMDNAASIVGVLAASADLSLTDIAGMAEALKYAGAVAEDAGWSLTQMTTAIGAATNAGLMASTAGEYLRTALMKVSATLGATEYGIKTTKAALSEYNIELLTSEGALKPLPDMIAEFKTKLEGLENAERGAIMTRIFGIRAGSLFIKLLETGSDALQEQADAYQYAAILEDMYSKGIKNGSEVLSRWNKEAAAGRDIVKQVTAEGYDPSTLALAALNDLYGRTGHTLDKMNTALGKSLTASVMLDARMGALSYQIEEANAAAFNAQATLGAKLAPAMLASAQAAEAFYKGIAALPGPLQAGIVGTMGFAGVAGQTVAGVMNLVGSLAMLSAAIQAQRSQQMLAIKSTLAHIAAMKAQNIRLRDATGQFISYASVTGDLTARQSMLAASSLSADRGARYLGISTSRLAMSMGLLLGAAFGVTSLLWVFQEQGPGVATAILGISVAAGILAFQLWGIKAALMAIFPIMGILSIIAGTLATSFERSQAALSETHSPSLADTIQTMGKMQTSTTRNSFAPISVSIGDVYISGAGAKDIQVKQIIRQAVDESLTKFEATLT